MSIITSVQLKDRKGKHFAEESRRVSCTRYDPCPICYKCMIKASHLFIKCQNCQVPICGHQERARNFMIRRENFKDRFMEFMPSSDEKFRKYEENKQDIQK